MKNYRYSNTNGEIQAITMPPTNRDEVSLANQNINEILIWLNGIKKSNNYILDEAFKKHIDSFMDFATSLRAKGITSINEAMFNASLLNSNNLLLDFSTCVGTDDEVKSCKSWIYRNNPVISIIANMFASLWNDDENRRIKALEQQNIISKQQAAKLQAEQDAKNAAAAEKLRAEQKEMADKQNQELLLKTQLTTLELQAKKLKNKKLMIGGAIAIVTIIGGIIAYKKLT